MPASSEIFWTVVVAKTADTKTNEGEAKVIQQTVAESMRFTDSVVLVTRLDVASNTVATPPRLSERRRLGKDDALITGMGKEMVGWPESVVYPDVKLVVSVSFARGS